MLAVVQPKGEEIVRVISDDLLNIILLSDEVQCCLEWISSINTNLGINFHTSCYVSKTFYIFAIEKSQESNEILPLTGSDEQG